MSAPGSAGERCADVVAGELSPLLSVILGEPVASTASARTDRAGLGCCAARVSSLLARGTIRVRRRALPCTGSGEASLRLGGLSLQGPEGSVGDLQVAVTTIW
jgi:hypothetical protein